MKQLGIRLRTLREGLGISQAKFAEIIGSTQSSTNRYENVWCFLFYPPFTLTPPFVKKAFVALRRVRQTQNINNPSSDHGQSTAETILNPIAPKEIYPCGQGHLMLCLNKIQILAH